MCTQMSSCLLQKMCNLLQPNDGNSSCLLFKALQVKGLYILIMRLFCHRIKIMNLSPFHWSLITCNNCSDEINENIEFTCDFCSSEPALKKFVFDGTENKNISRDFIKYLTDVEARLIQR